MIKRGVINEEEITNFNTRIYIYVKSYICRGLGRESR